MPAILLSDPIILLQEHVSFYVFVPVTCTLQYWSVLKLYAEPTVTMKGQTISEGPSRLKKYREKKRKDK